MYAADQAHRSAGKSTPQSAAPPAARRPDPAKCPRCASTNTKFCYYNNYNKSQPRHFCKSCKRHWTKGGTLRNVPVGGARKNKRPKISSAAAASNDQKTASSILYRALIAEKTDNATADQFEFSSATSYHYVDLDIPGSSGGPWPGPDTGSCFDSLPNYWNWSEIEALASSDHLNATSWDEIKP